MTAAMTGAVLAFTWDEPEGCSTPRGWVHLDNHPDEAAHDGGSTCVGNFLMYFDPAEPFYKWSSRGPNGETVHACAYIFRYNPLRPYVENIGLGHAWFHTIEEAKAFIESNVAAYFGKLPHNGGHR